MEYVTLNNGVEMPILGFGVYQIEDAAVCEESVYQALMTGYRSIDTASAYFNEEAVGRAITRSGIPREELFITSKVWIQDYGYEATKKAFETTLEKLQVDYLDLYLIHQAFNDYYGAWRAMEELYEAGKIRAIGVCNFNSRQMVDLVTYNRIVPAVNQIEHNPLFQQNEIKPILKKYNIQLEAWGPFAEGMFDIFDNEILNQIGQKYGKTAAQVILRWTIQLGIVTIPKSVHKERIEENFAIWDFELTQADMDQIATLDLGKSNIIDLDSAETIEALASLKVH
ncbi:aldo/keto reductase [Fundicoccus culcitae]|uniref:Aldo/keto reductase n=1 Tax=Fundicoccus culcitae TaxID=2969821 RepID=A0ABY5P299_9LACT|nr:aldo/keto reductase [Fundicoccus culcitae]UUX32764.1 aldo/keto reductase [Fundicoccus culcitae]